MKLGLGLGFNFSPDVQFVWLLAAHFIADFLLQSSDMAQRKSKEPLVLFAHCAVHWLVFLCVAWTFLPYHAALVLASLTASLHGIVDWNIWRAYRRWREPAGPEFRWWEDHWFYVVIGADQFLHGASIIFARWYACR